MSYAPTDIERENGEVKAIHFECERTELRQVVDDIHEIVVGLPSVNDAVKIRRKKKNPVIKTQDNDLIYFKWDNGNANVNVRMLDDEMTRAIEEYFSSQQTEQEQDDFPWDREEVEEEARERIRERQRETSSEDESRQRAREEGNHRSEQQREPRGGTERRGRDQAEIVDGKTKFTPPYEKDEVDYHGPASGDNPHLDCKDCVHFIEGGGCHMVQGEIDPDGYCEDLYADVGIFARMFDGEFEINLAMWGEMFEDRFGRVSINQIGNRVKEAIRKKL